MEDLELLLNNSDEQNGGKKAKKSVKKSVKKTVKKSASKKSKKSASKKTAKKPVKKAKKATKKTKKAKTVNPWLVHVKKTMKENPKADFKDILKMAKKTYKKV